MYNKVNIFREEAEEESKGPCRWRDANGAVLFFATKTAGVFLTRKNIRNS